MIRDRQRYVLVLFCHDNVAAALARNTPAERLKYPNNFSSAEAWDDGHLRRDLNLSCLDRQRQSLVSANFETKGDCFLNVFQGSLLTLALTDTPRDCGALNDPHTIFVSVNRHVEFHLDLRLQMIACVKMRNKRLDLIRFSNAPAPSLPRRRFSQLEPGRSRRSLHYSDLTGADVDTMACGEINPWTRSDKYEFDVCARVEQHADIFDHCS
jgi:hypothetical protein